MKLGFQNKKQKVILFVLGDPCAVTVTVGFVVSCIVNSASGPYVV